MSAQTIRLADAAEYTDDDALRAYLADQFSIAPTQLVGVELIVVYVSVGMWGCDSSAFVIGRRDGALFEVHGSHCSCHGFEGQWDEEPAPDVAAIIARPDWSLAGGGYDNDIAGNAALIREALAALAKARGEA